MKGRTGVDRITFLGHSTALLRLGGTTILTDPVLRDRVGPLRRHRPPPGRRAATAPSADVVVVSHLHRDHLDLPSLRELPAESPMIVPRGAGSLASRAGARDIREMSVGDELPIGGVVVRAVPAVHDSRRGPWGPRAQALGFLIDSGRRRVYFAGDTDLFPEMWEFEDLDLALLPVWGWGPTVGSGHLNPWRAALALRRLAPRVAVPIHWGTFYPLGLSRLRPRALSDPPIQFARFAAELAPESRVHVLAPGSGLDLDDAGEG